MTKLNVVIPAVNVMVEIGGSNAEYRKVDRKAQAGDIVKVISSDYDMQYGGFYLVGDGPSVVDDVNDRVMPFGMYPEDFEVYAPVSAESTAPAYREVKRKAAVGERIKIVNTCDRRWSNGEEFVVERTGGSGVMIKHPQGNGGGGCAGVFNSEYVVLEPINAQAKAESAAKPKRLTVGDYAKVVNPKGYREHRRGQIVEIFKDTHEGQPFNARSLTDGGENWYCEHEITLATAEEVSAARAEAQRVAQRKLAVGTFAGGGFAVVVDESKSGSLDGFENGQHVTVADKYGYAGRYALKVTLPGGFYGYCNADALRQITEAEYNAATAPKPKFSVGDSVQINVPESETTRYGRALVKNSEIGTVTKVSGERVTVTFPSYGGGWDGIASELTRVSAEELAAIEKETQETAKWNAIGRKVGEFKRGDIVSFACTGGEKGVGTVEDSGAAQSAIGVRMGATVYDGSAYKGVFFREGDSATLITPVEQRFDTQSAA